MKVYFRFSFLSLLGLMLSSELLVAQFSGGSGTLASPYVISTFANLDTLSRNSAYWNKHFIQSAHIDASASASMNSGAGFLPIANPTTPFSGSYNGQNYAITGLTINRPTTSSVGLFSEISGATIANLQLLSAVVTGNNNVGGIVGWSGSGAQLSNVHIDANSMITGSDDVGGIVGEAENTGLENCHSSATVDGNDTTGGLIGFCDLAGTAKTVKSCSFTGMVTGDGDDVGGLIGSNEQRVEDCFSDARVSSLDATGDDNYGVLIGLNKGELLRCYANGIVVASGINVGGLIGRNEAAVNNCYSIVQVIGTSDVGGLIGYTTGSVTNCFAMGSVRGNDDTGGLIGNQISGSTISACYAAVRVMNESDDEISGLIAERDGAVLNCFWVDIFGDDYAFSGDEENNINVQIKQVSDRVHPLVSYSLAEIQGSNAPTALTFLDFVNHWEPAPNGVPGAFPVLRNVTPPSGAPLAPTGFTANGGNNLTNLAWSSNGETDIAAYKIYRGDTKNFEPSSANLLATIPHSGGGMNYTDDGNGLLPAPVNGTLYFYGLTAVDQESNESLVHYGAAKPGEFTATVQLALEINGVVYSETHGDISPDVYAVYSNEEGGNITSYHTAVVDGCGDNQGLFHPRNFNAGLLTITPVGLQPGQNWYLFYDDNTVNGYPIRNTSGQPGSGTTLVTGSGNTPVSLTVGIDGLTTDYMFYVDRPLINNTAPIVTNLLDVSVSVFPQKIATDIAISDVEMGSFNAGVGNYSGMNISIHRLGGINVNDIFGLTAPNADFVISGGIIQFFGKPIGTYQITAGAIDIYFEALEIIINQDIVNSIVQNISYAHATSSSMPDQITLKWTISDGLAELEQQQVITLDYYSGGTGTTDNPWQLSTWEDLADLSQNQAHWADFIMVTADIDATASAFLDDSDDDADGNPYNDPNDLSSAGSNSGFSAIGNSSFPFTGNFSGAGYAVSGLFISRASTNNTGFFGVTQGAQIDSLRLLDVQITGADATGALIGWAMTSEVSFCQVAGSLTGAAMTGGLIGKAENSTVYQCFATGQVQGGNDCGGLIGSLLDNNTSLDYQLSNAYANCQVSGQMNVGGLIGESQVDVVNCYSNGMVIGVANVGGLIGYSAAGTIRASFWDTETSGISSAGTGIPASTSTMLSYCTYSWAEWDMAGESTNGDADIWILNQSVNSGYPALAWQGWTHQATCADRPFVLEITPAAGTTSLELQALTSAEPVNYFWKAEPSGNIGVGSFTRASLGVVSIVGLSGASGEVITLSIEPSHLQRVSLFNTNTNTFPLDLIQWGDVAWSSMEYAFADCNLLIFSALDTPNLSAVSSLSNMFYQATSFNEPLNHWDVSVVSNFQGMFSGASSFNQPLNEWNTANATDMSFMFSDASSFNQNINSWNIAMVTTMASMLKNATNYNQPLGDWTFKSGVVLTDFLADCGLDCINYARTLNRWSANVNMPDNLALVATNVAYGNSAVNARDVLINDSNWTITGDVNSAGPCPICPVLSVVPDDVIIVNSNCVENCAPSGGSIAEPIMGCPIGYSMQYSVDAGAWSNTLPDYQQSGSPQTIKTRCVCDEDLTSIGPESIGVTTNPGTCVVPVAAISGIVTICAGGTTTLTADSGQSFLWSTNETTSSITVSPLASSSYGLTITEANGCKDSTMVSVTVKPLPAISCPDDIMITSSSNGTSDCFGLVQWEHPTETAGACGPVSLSMQLNANTAVAVVPGTEITSPFAVGLHTVVYSLTDGGMNSTSCSFNIQVIDDEAPTINCYPIANVVLNGQSTFTLVPAQLADISDNCGSTNAVIYPPQVNIAQLGQSIPVNIIANDVAGNYSSCTTVVEVSGLPESWRHNSGSVGNCQSQVTYTPSNSVWTASAMNCVYLSPFQNDQMMFAQRQLCGDGSITAQIINMSGAQGWAGIAMRESNAEGAKKIHMLINLSSNVLQREVRTSTGAQAVPQYMSNPQNRTWLRIVRHGNQFTGYSSHDGLTWWFVLRSAIPMNACIEIGLNLINMYPNQLTYASYGNVLVTGNSAPPTVVINDNAAAMDMPHTVEFDIYPNPADGHLTIKLAQAPASSGIIKVYSQLGVLVFQGSVSEQLQRIDLTKLPDGMYWVQYETHNKISTVQRLLLHR